MGTNKTIVKICGLKREKDVKTCMRLGVDVLGFVTEYPISVPWNLDRAQARELLSLVRRPCKTCLVTGGSPEKVIALAERLQPSMVQLHFKETQEDTVRIAQVLKRLNIRTIKTFPMTGEERIHQFGTTDTAHIVKSLCETDIYGILVDSRTPANAVQQGTPMDISLYTQIKSLSKKTVILAGGITPDNVRKMTGQTKADYIDVMTGVEESPGIKDEIRLINLLSRLKSTETPHDTA